MRDFTAVSSAEPPSDSSARPTVSRNLLAMLESGMGRLYASFAELWQRGERTLQELLGVEQIDHLALVDDDTAHVGQVRAFPALAGQLACLGDTFSQKPHR